MCWVGVLSVTNVCSCNNQFFLVLVKEYFPVQSNNLFFAEVPLVESRLVG
jgi:hypothetical protein